MPLPATSTTAVTRAIVLGTLAALIVVGTLSVLIYRSTLSGAVAQHSAQQLAMVRTAAIGVQGEIRGLSALLRQFSSLPSVQNLDVAFLGQRIEAAFGENPNGIVRYVARLGADGRLFYWTPKGELMAGGVPTSLDPAQWHRLSDPASRGLVRVGSAWWIPDSPQELRVLFTPVWRTSPSSENPVPPNDFNGTVGLAIDLSRLVEVYLGPAITELADDQLVVDLAVADFGVRMGPGGRGITPVPGHSASHLEPQGIAVLAEEGGRRVHAWSHLDAADQSWLVASSSPYGRATAQVQRSAIGQLALMTMLLVAVPLGGWLLYRRERNTQEGQRQLERKLAESQKMEAIGKLAGGVAHDFNNMLTAILGYSSMLYDDAPATSPVREHAGQIRRAAESAAALTQKLLAFSRRQVLQTNQFDFVAMLDGLLLLVRRVIGEGITVKSDPQPGLWPVLADPSQVEQSIVNLAINARDAMPDGGTLRIVARNAPRPDGEHRPDGEVRPGNYVQITVSDNGTGMDAATRERMFEPFFTTKPYGKGTGLGLSTVYGFIRQCGGYIFVTSTPGLGTSIELLLPRAPDMPLAAPAPPPTPTPVRAVADGTMETILVAEDEAEVRRLVVETLRRAGYTVIHAGSGDDALRVADGYDGAIHLLVSDVVMPGMKGPELAARLRAARPSIQVLLMSGYAADVVTKDDLKEAALLSKPFPPSLLAKTVRQVLDQPLSRGPRPKG
jgi:signal transduction histidine kinase/CheY-like chemotaxis protein